MANALTKPDNAGAGATDYMHLFGLVALGAMWVRIAAAAEARIASGDSRAARLRAEIGFGRVFMERAMPETALRLARVTSGADAVMALPEEAF
jgi:glutamate-1-semialdehyde aminotransferase